MAGRPPVWTFRRWVAAPSATAAHPAARRPACRSARRAAWPAVSWLSRPAGAGSSPQLFGDWRRSADGVRRVRASRCWAARQRCCWREDANLLQISGRSLYRGRYFHGRFQRQGVPLLQEPLKHRSVTYSAHKPVPKLLIQAVSVRTVPGNPPQLRQKHCHFLTRLLCGTVKFIPRHYHCRPWSKMLPACLRQFLVGFRRRQIGRESIAQDRRAGEIVGDVGDLSPRVP